MIDLIQFVWNMFTTDWVMISCGLVAVASVALLVKVAAPIILPCASAALKPDNGEYWSPWGKVSESLVSKDFDDK